jgi:ankyrin repeat protein
MSFRGKVESARLLIRNRADVNVQDQDYLTPLQLAISSGSTEAVELLVQHGADANALDRMFEGGSEEDSIGYERV